MFWIRWLRHEAARIVTRHGPVWSTLHNRTVCRCGETCQRVKMRNQGRHW
ncbi:hypothetical protein H4W31_001250 [Plantactinospora soyae]|uniref:Uncharacterized protein n=1 Tax=Plantactinospora soyae TaxID=1544732 RepID=A0A927QWJ0_9ACTN|nr:hypothetical protein [Plantactinospora soyae]